MRSMRLTKRTPIMATMIVAVVVWLSEGVQARPIPGRTSETGPAVEGTIWTFDDVPLGGLPAGWKAETTNREGPPAMWSVVEDATAPSGGRVLAMTRADGASGETFNICWTDAVIFLDGEIRARFKAVRGEEDQGGGVIWRVRDRDNYDIARFNPLEDNFRVYHVRGGVRRTLADARVVLPVGTWHEMVIVQHGDRFEGFLDGRKLLEGEDDRPTESGGVGLWTKADAVTSFDDFSVWPSEAQGGGDE